MKNTDEVRVKRNWPVRFSSVWLVAVLLLACTADPPVLQQDKTATVDLSFVPDWPPNCQTAPQLGAPVLDPYPNPTAYELQAFRGRCGGAERVLARGGAGTAAPAMVSADGKFCIEVRLLADSPNSITFGGVDANGCPGRETIVNINHQTAPRKDAGIASPINLAKNASISSSPNPEEGQLSHVNDGDPGSSAKFSFWDPDPTGSACDGFAWVRLDLGKVYTISRMKIRWAQGAGSDFAKCYAVLLSAQSAPGDPSTTGGWKVMKQESAADASEQIISINPEPARWAALLMYENDGTGLYETFKLAEFEVIGQDPDATPPPPPDRCQ